MKRLKKIVIQLHKITGSLLSLLFLIWFLSGIVLIFDGFPHASREARFNHLSTFTEANFIGLAPPETNWKGQVNLELCNGKPVYRLVTGRKAQQVFDAKTLKPYNNFSEEYANKLASSFSGSPVKKTELQNEFDQWVPWSYYKPLLPFYKCYINNPSHTVLYISQKTGEIVQQTDRKSRWAARCGAIPHWIYLKNIRPKQGLWMNLVIILSAIGVLVSLTGIIAGFLRFKKGKGITPYKKLFYKWHHIFGFIFGLFVFTFILSGLFSVIDVPDWMVFIPTKNEKKINWGQKLDLAKHPAIFPYKIYEALEQKEGIRKVSWKNMHGTPSYFVYYNNYQIPVVYQLTGDSIQKHTGYSISEIEKIAKGYLGETAFSIIQQEKYDNYYSGSAMYYWPEPVYKLVADDAAQTWIYINPATAEQVKRYTKNTRLRRWLYQGLHKFNFQFLKEEAEWFRKLLLIITSLGGIAVSITGVWLSKKWLRRTIRKTKKHVTK
nr:PepSY domain-containing protein [uncultured Draconibacterium sp.]